MTPTSEARISFADVGVFFTAQRGTEMAQSIFSYDLSWRRLVVITTLLVCVNASADEMTTLADAIGSGKTALDLRYRFEMVDQTGISNKAMASTLRTRLNYTTGSYNKLNAFLEVDNVSVVGSTKYNDATGLPGAKSQYPAVADPAGTEVNQAYLAYAGLSDTTIKYGRQRLILDNARFIGNVGWRQNEQTYDAVTLVNTSLPSTTVVYGYVSNVNRIFGEASAKGNIDTQAHLINLSYSGMSAGKLSVYGYLLDLIDTPTVSNKTVGARFNGGTGIDGDTKFLYSLEYAKQSSYKDGAASIDAPYTLTELGTEIHGVTAKLGREKLGGDGAYAFSTPLATLHAFNGWADMFLTTPVSGLIDTYMNVSGTYTGVKLMAIYHDFKADSGGASYGTETDLMAMKKIGNYSLMTKYASYSADSYASDTKKLWLMGQASF